MISILDLYLYFGSGRPLFVYYLHLGLLGYLIPFTTQDFIIELRKPAALSCCWINPMIFRKSYTFYRTFFLSIYPFASPLSIDTTFSFMFSICITAAAGTDLARKLVDSTLISFRLTRFRLPDKFFILSFILYMLGQAFTHCLIFSTADA